MHIITSSCTLRDWVPGDAGSLARHANNPRIAVMLRDAFPSPYTLDDAYRFISMATGPTPNLFLAIEVRGEAVGGIGIHPLDDVKRRSAEIGYWLSESLWGKGIVTDAVRFLVPVAFERYDIVRLQAGIFSNNPASMQVLEKCGFIREAVHRNAITKNGASLDEVMYGYFG
jgi:ribosomal-protein-alanine N-acetyltransferase